MQQSGGKVEQSGIWTVQPGNTPNTTPWLVTSGVTKGATPTRTTLTPSLSSQTLVPANANRLGLRIIHNAVDPSQWCWIHTGTASSTSFTTRQQGSFEIALFVTEWPYSGAYTLISDVASGSTQIIELTA